MKKKLLLAASLLFVLGPAGGTFAFGTPDTTPKPKRDRTSHTAPMDMKNVTVVDAKGSCCHPGADCCKNGSCCKTKKAAK